MTRLIDRMGITRAAGYNENMYTGAVAVPTFDRRGRSLEAASADLVRHAREAYRDNGPVFAVALVRMALLAEARFKFQRASDRKLYGNTNLVLLEQPWPNADSGDLWARLDMGETTAGGAYVRRVTPAGAEEDRLLMLRPDLVTIASSVEEDVHGNVFKVPVGYIEDMRAQGIDRDPQYYPVEEIAHYAPAPDPDALWRGKSWLSVLLREVAGDQAVTSYRTAHLDNGAMPGLIVKYSRKMKDETIETLRRRMTARHGGPQNAGKVLILDEGADAMVAGSTLEQLQTQALSAVGERRICAAGGPGMNIILGFEAGDYQSAIRKLADLWARPRWHNACAALQHLVPNMPASGVRLWYDVGDIAALREGELQRAQSFLVRTQGLAACVTAGFTRDSSVAAADSGDISLLVESKDAPPPGGAPKPAPPAPGQEAPGGPGGGALNGRAPQAGKPQNLPGAVKPDVPNALPAGTERMPAVPGGPRGQVNGRKR